MNDFMGLKKLDKDLKKIFNDKPLFKDSHSIIKGDIIGNKNKKGRNRNQSKNGFITEKDKKVVKDTVKYSKDVINFLYKYATKNNLPNDYDSLCLIAEKYFIEEKTEREKKDVIEFIKTYRKLQREERKMKRIARLKKVGSLFKRKEKEITRFCSQCGRPVLVWGDFAKQLCIVCDEVNRK